MRAHKIAAVLSLVAAASGLFVITAPAASAGYATQTFYLRNMATGRCLDANPAASAGQRVIIGTCAVSQSGYGYRAEIFQLAALNDTALLINNGLCVFRSTVTTTSSPLLLQSCASGSDTYKMWKIHDLGVINGEHVVLIGPPGGPVRLDGNFYNAYTNVPNNGNYQKWILQPVPDQ